MTTKWLSTIWGFLCSLCAYFSEYFHCKFCSIRIERELIKYTFLLFCSVCIICINIARRDPVWVGCFCFCFSTFFLSRHMLQWQCFCCGLFFSCVNDTIQLLYHFLNRLDIDWCWVLMSRVKVFIASPFPLYFKIFISGFSPLPALIIIVLLYKEWIKHLECLVSWTGVLLITVPLSSWVYYHLLNFPKVKSVKYIFKIMKYQY